MLELSIEPPSGAARGRLSVLVRKHSIDRTVPVEFDLEAAAL